MNLYLTTSSKDFEKLKVLRSHLLSSLSGGVPSNLVLYNIILAASHLSHVAPSLPNIGVIRCEVLVILKSAGILL